MELIKSLLLWAIEKPKLWKNFSFWPLMAWFIILTLAEAKYLALGDQAAEWLRALLVPITGMAPLIVKEGEAIGIVFSILFAFHWSILSIIRRGKGISPAQRIHNHSILEAEGMILMTAIGWVSAFAVPYQPQVPSCLWLHNCPAPQETYLLTGAMAGYLILMVVALVRKLGEMEMNIEKQQEEEFRAWIQ